MSHYATMCNLWHPDSALFSAIYPQYPYVFRHNRGALVSDLIFDL